MTDTSHISYNASYALDPSNSRAIQSVPALPGQRQLGRFNLSTSRFFSRRSLLGSSATGVQAPAFTREPERLPESLGAAGRRSARTVTGHPHTQSSQTRHARQPQQAHTVSTRHRQHLPQQQPAEVAPTRRARTPARLPASAPAEYPEIARLRAKIAAWQDRLEPPHLSDQEAQGSAGHAEEHRRAKGKQRQTRVDTDSSLDEYDHPDTPSVPDTEAGGENWAVANGMVANASETYQHGPHGWIGDEAAILQQRRQSKQSSSSETSGSSSASGSAFSGRLRPKRSISEATTSQRISKKASLTSQSANLRKHRVGREEPERPLVTRGDPQTGLTGPPIHGLRPPASAHIRVEESPRPTEPPEGYRLHRVTTTYYGRATDDSVTPVSGKAPSLASLPRLSSSARAPLGEAATLQAFVSDGDSTSSFHTHSRRNTPNYPQSPARAAFVGRPLSDVQEQRESGISENGELQQPIKKIRTKYGDTYTRYEDRLPFEPAIRPASPPPIPVSRPHSTAPAYPAYHGDLHPDQYPRKRQPHRQEEVPYYSFEGRNDEESKNFARSLAEARQELRSIFSEKTGAVRSPSLIAEAEPLNVHAVPVVEAPRVRGSDNASSKSRTQSSSAKQKPKEPSRLQRAVSPPLHLPTAASTEDEDDEHHGDGIAEKAMKKRMAFQKPPTPYAKAIESASGVESGATSEVDADPPTDTAGESAPRRKKKKKKRELVSALKKSTPGLPTPGQTPILGSSSDAARKSVHFGGATPADVGGNFSPPPHSSQDSPSTAASADPEPPTSPSKDRKLRPHVYFPPPPPPPGQDNADGEDEHVFRDLSDVKPKPFDFSKFGLPDTGALEPTTSKAPAASGPPTFDFTLPGQSGSGGSKKQTRVDEDSDDDDPPPPKPGTNAAPRQKLPLPPVPGVDEVYRKLPAAYLANGILACKGLSIYGRLREVVWDYAADLEDVNKRRERYWLPLADACEKLIMKIQKSLYDQTTKRLLPLFREIMGNDEDPKENSIIFARRAVTAQIKQIFEYTQDALKEYNDIVHGADEILDLAGEVENISLAALRGFRAAYIGFSHIETFFRHLFEEINQITHLIRNSFIYIHQVPSASELAEMPDEHIARLKASRDDLVEWYDGMLASIRKWRTKITYANFERQLSALRNLDRKWAEADDVQLGMIKALFCFGFCLPRQSRNALKELEGKKATTKSPDPAAEAQQIKTEQPRRQPMMTQEAFIPQRAPPKPPERQPSPLPSPPLPAERPSSDKRTDVKGKGKKKKRKEDESDSDSSALELPDLRKTAGSVPPRDEQIDLAGPILSSRSSSGSGMVHFLQNDPAFNALSDEEKLVVIRHMLEQAREEEGSM